MVALRVIRPPIDRVYSSPFYRCIQTVTPFLRALGREGGEAEAILDTGIGYAADQLSFLMKLKMFMRTDVHPENGMGPHDSITPTLPRPPSSNPSSLISPSTSPPPSCPLRAAKRSQSYMIVLPTP